MTTSPTLPESPCGMGPSDLDAGLGAEPSAAKEKAPSPPRACLTCIHRTGSLRRGKCAATGYYLEVERKSPGPCGWRGLLWAPMPQRVPGLIERIWRAIFGYQPPTAAREHSSPRQVSQPIRETK